MDDARVETLRLFAWVGEDELGSGEVGIKQGLVPAGLIPLVSVDAAKLDRGVIAAAMQAQAIRYGKTIRLCEFRFERVVTTLDP